MPVFGQNPEMTKGHRSGPSESVNAWTAHRLSENILVFSKFTVNSTGHVTDSAWIAVSGGRGNRRRHMTRRYRGDSLSAQPRTNLILGPGSSESCKRDQGVKNLTLFPHRDGGTVSETRLHQEKRISLKPSYEEWVYECQPGTEYKQRLMECKLCRKS